LSTQSFRALGASEHVCAALQQRGITAPFPIQELVLPDALAGRDVLAKSPTGSGKTLAFAIPMAERISRDARVPAGLVLVPTRELAMQVADETAPIARSRGLRVATAFGGVGIHGQAQKAARSHILVATPGRLEDLLERRLVRLDGVSLLVLDEADRMLDLGFRPAVDRIVQQTLFFSATLDGEVNRLATRYTRDAVRVEHHTPEADIGAIEHRFLMTKHEDKLDRLVDVLGDERELALVFVRTKRGASRLATRLERRGVRVAALHGDMTQPQRTRSLDRFARGHADTLVATDVAARGLDIDAITHVINFDPPDDDPSYVHRVGRTGRAGRTGTSVTLVLDDQREAVNKMATLAGVDEPRCERTDTLLVTPGQRLPAQGHRSPRQRQQHAQGPRGNSPRPGEWRRNQQRSRAT
jgi:ATP-dependent RNA helicase RhlE